MRAIAATVAGMSPAVLVATAVEPAFQLNGTTWTYAENGVENRMSIDEDGTYVEQTVGGRHIDHGVAVMKGNKACFATVTSRESETCWTLKPLEVGESMVTVGEAGQRMKITRVKYVPLRVPGQGERR